MLSGFHKTEVYHRALQETALFAVVINALEESVCSEAAKYKR